MLDLTSALLRIAQWTKHQPIHAVGQISELGKSAITASNPPYEALPNVMPSIFEINLLPGCRDLLWLSISLKISQNEVFLVELFASVRVP